MPNDQQTLRIGIVTPEIQGHRTRGTGTYAMELYNALRNVPHIHVDQIDSEADSDRYDLIHYPSFDPFFLTLPWWRTKPTVVTVHDLIPLRYPEQFPPGMRGKLKWQIQRFALSRVNAIITDSEASKADIITYTGIPPEMIRVVYLGVSSLFQPVESQERIQEIVQKYGLPKQFILHVGDVNYNKNSLRLFKALSTLRGRGEPVHLVCVGKGFVTPTKELAQLQSYIQEHTLESEISFPGYIPLDDLVCLYSAAMCYVHPSLAEGFGLPVLDAMACGCPTVVSDTTSLSEIATGVAVMVDPEKVGTIADGISRVLGDAPLRQELRRKGVEHAKHFTWEKTARETANIYLEVIQNNQ